MEIYDLLKEKRAEILRVAAEHGARNVRIFGSVARGEAKAASDVDLLVDMDPGRSLLDLGGLLMDLQDILGCPVDVATEKGLAKTNPRRGAKRSRGAIEGRSVTELTNSPSPPRSSFVFHLPSISLSPLFVAHIRPGGVKMRAKRGPSVNSGPL